MPLAPIPDELSAPWWEAAARGEILFQRCADCARPQFYPRARCAACGGGSVAWERSAGAGRLLSFSLVRRAGNEALAADVPYVLALVELDEGVVLTTRMRGDADTLRCDARVRMVAPAAGDEFQLPYAEVT